MVSKFYIRFCARTLRSLYKLLIEFVLDFVQYLTFFKSTRNQTGEGGDRFLFWFFFIKVLVYVETNLSLIYRASGELILCLYLKLGVVGYGSKLKHLGTGVNHIWVENGGVKSFRSICFRIYGKNRKRDGNNRGSIPIVFRDPVLS